MKAMRTLWSMTIILAFVISLGTVSRGQVNPCPIPTGPTVTAVSGTTVSLSWISTGAQAYQVSYCPSGNPAWQSMTTTVPNVTLTGLMPNMTYAWLVRSVCLGSATNTMVTSPWSVIGYFATGQAPPSCHASFFFTFLTNPTPVAGMAVQFTSTSTGVNNTTQYLWNFGDGTNSSLMNPVHVFLQPGTYNVCLTITTILGNAATSICTNTTCHTVVIPVQPGCLPPANLLTSNITNHSATLSWSNTTAQSYQVRYRKLASTNSGSPWIYITNQTNTITLTNLVPSSYYEWQVRSFCGPVASNTTMSPWSPSVTFITTAFPLSFKAGASLVTWHYEGREACQANLEVFDLTGMLIYSADRLISPGENSIDLSDAALKNGVYLLRLNAAGQAYTQKFTCFR